MSLQLPSPLRRGSPAVLALVLAAGLAACGASGSGNDGVVSLASPSAAPGASAAPSAPVDPEEAMQAFTTCMKEHGIDVQVATVADGATAGGVKVGGPTLSSSGPATGADPQTATGKDFDPKAMEAADKACRALLPSGTLGDPSATMDPAIADQLLAFAKCMRDHGVDFPDPVFSGNGVSVQVGGPAGNAQGGVDPASKAFQDAQTACAKDVPGGGPFVVGGTSSGTNP